MQVNGLKFIASVFRRSEKGATAVEFAILLPVMIVVFAAIVEGSRIYWNYQSAVTGVRDAARYLARITDSDICATTAGPAIPGGGAEALFRIQQTMRDEGGLFPAGVTIAAGSVSANFVCTSTPGLRIDPTPVAVVQATVNIQLPFGEVFNFFGARSNATMTSVIRDQSRIYGV